jgi:hypothetical protein
MGDSIVLCQIKLLQILGFFSFTTKTNRSFTYTRNVVALCILLGSWTSFGLNFAQSLGMIIRDQESDLLVKIFRNLPYCTINLRPALVLSIAFFKRSSSETLLLASNRFYKIFSSLETIDKSTNVRLWQRRPILALLYTATLMSLWFAWFIESHILWNLEMSLFNDEVMAPLPIKMQVWQYIIFLLIFMLITFILSQQVFMILLFSASSISKVLKNVNHSIKKTIEEFAKNSDKRSWNDLEQQLADWKKVHLTARNFCNDVNKYFHLILFVIFCMDFITMVGFGANILVPGRLGLQEYTFSSFSILMFCQYSTVFMIPLISAHEQVSFQMSYSNIMNKRTTFLFQSLEISNNGQRLIDVTEERLLETAEVLLS